MATEQTTNERGAETGRDGGLQAARQNRHGTYYPRLIAQGVVARVIFAYGLILSINLEQCKQSDMYQCIGVRV